MASCDAQSESAAFRSQCASHIRERDAELSAQQFRRGLSIQWRSSPKLGVFTNLWGAGHTLPVLCRLHALCRRVRRYCYISVYDTAFESYFGYANGMGWWLKRGDLRRYPNKERIDLQCNRSRHDLRFYEPFIEGELERTVAASAAALVQVTVRGWLPMHNAVGYAESERLPADEVCACRYATEPLLKRRAALARWLLQPERPPGRLTALHLRTGFADVEQSLAKGLPADASSSARWLAAACGADPFADGAPRFVMSDAPGLLRALSARYAHVATNAPPANTSTRSWFTSDAVRFAVYDDLVVAGLATTLLVAPQERLPRLYHPASAAERLGGVALQYSGFGRAVLARSVCVRQARGGVAACPRFARVFPRNWLEELTGFVAGLPRERDAGELRAANLTVRAGAKWAKRFVKRREQLSPRDHPCANGTDPRACLVDLVAALK